MGVWNYYEPLNVNNFLLLNKDAGIGDDLLEPFNKLYINGKDNDIEFTTLDMVADFNQLDGVVFFDFPRLTNPYVKEVFKLDLPKYLVIFECDLIRPENWDLKCHELFDVIFTSNDEFVNNIKYFKLNFSHDLSKDRGESLTKKEKLCTLIAGNKRNNGSLELYSKRVEAIEWFEENDLDSFDLYGVGWDKFTTSNKYINFILNKFNVSGLFATNRPSYKGRVDSKKEVLEKYKFAICYENARDIPGYVTEKIFDCFFSGCVPIYWGANNISDHIPKECFVDKREFSSYDDLYEFISNMNEDVYLSYLENIELFLNGEKSYQFSSEYFSKQIISNLI